MLWGGFITEGFSKVFCPKNFLPFLGGKQEGNGPIDSRAMVMTSDIKLGIILEIKIGCRSRAAVPKPTEKYNHK